MANRKIEFTEEQQKEIEAVRKNNKNKNAERRLCVLSMKARGKSNEEIVSRTGYNGAYARRLIAKYFSEGIEAILGKKRQGNNRNIPYSTEAEFVNGFIEQAKQGHLTTVKDIKAAYENLVGHKIGSGHIYVILNRHGWRKIKPRPAHPKKATEADIEASKKLTLD
jgi:transposase